MEQDTKKAELEKKLNTISNVTNSLNSQLKYYYNKETNILEELEKIENLRKDTTRYKDYLKGLDKEYKTNCAKKIKETPLLLALFQEFVQQTYTSSKFYELIHKTKILISDDLNKTLNDEQKNMLEQWKYCEDRILDDMIEQAFIYGYSMAVQFRDEAIKQYPNKT